MRSKDPIYVFDARLVDRHLRQGLIAEADLQSFVQSLPDRAENAEVMSLPADSRPAPDPASRNTL